MKKTTRTSLTGKALSEKIGQLKMSAPDGNFVFQFCGLKTLAFSLHLSQELNISPFDKRIFFDTLLCG
jgi:hypothetical protein